VKTQHLSNESTIERLLPHTNHNARDRAAAWNEWYTHTGRDAVLAFIRVKNHTAEPDMDILQDAMMTAYTNVERGHYTPHPGVPFTAYVKGIAYNKIREVWRRTRRLTPLEDAPLACLEDEAPHIESLIETRERRNLFRSGLARLTPSRRQVLELYARGHATAEIARVLDISEDAVRQHKCRGLRRLRALAAQR